MSKSKEVSKEQRLKERERKVLREIVELAGGQVSLAEKLARKTKRPINQSHISNMINVYKAPMPPAELVIPMEKIVNRQVTRHKARPDLYPYEPPDVYPVRYPHNAKTLAEYFERETAYRLKNNI